MQCHLACYAKYEFSNFILIICIQIQMQEIEDLFVQVKMG